MIESPRPAPRFSHAFSFQPLCGTVGLDYDAFQYFIIGQDQQDLYLTSPWWLDEGLVLQPHSSVALHIPIVIGSKFYCRGLVTHSVRDPHSNETLFCLSLVPATPMEWPMRVILRDTDAPSVEFSQPLRDILLRGVHQCVLLKKAVFVYLKHLAAYFSRVTGLSVIHYQQFNQFYFDDILSRISEKITKLQAIEDSVRAQQNSSTSPHINFEDLHPLITTEVSLDLLNLAFHKSRHLSYVIAVKEVEEQLYWTYNLLLLTSEALVTSQGETGLFVHIMDKPSEPRPAVALPPPPSTSPSMGGRSSPT